MTQLQFSLNMDILKDSVMNSNMEAVVKSTIVLVLNEYMEKERDAYLKAEAYERTETRKDYRNGYYDRNYTMSIGKIELRVPRTRSGEFSPSVFEKYKRVDQAFTLAMLEMVVNGVSTRKVTNIVKELCGEEVSKSFVSSLTAKLDPIVREWTDRPLNTMYCPYVFVDAMYIKVREHQRVVSKAVYIATAINEENKREVLGLKVDHQESLEAWQVFLESLVARGLSSPKLIISDAHKGLKKAIAKTFVGTSWQRCTVHFKRNILAKLPKKRIKEILPDIKRIFHTVKPGDARRFKEEFILKYQADNKLEAASKILDEGFEDAIQYLSQPEKYHPFIHSTNHLERLNEELRRRETVIRIFPNTQSAFRLLGAHLMEYAETKQQQRAIFKH